MPSKKDLVEAVEGYFSATYLFDPAHELFRALVSPPYASSDLPPPMLPVVNLLSFPDVVAACSNDGDRDSKLQEIISSLKECGSSLVELVTNDSGVACVRRKQLLRDEEDPSHRSVVVIPVHADASNDSIESYMNPYGKVVAINRRRVPKGAVIVFGTTEAAMACAAATHSYGELPVAFGRPFVPKLVVQRFCDYAADVSEAVKLAEDKQLQHNIVEAQRSLASSKANEPFEVKRHLPARRTLHAVGVSGDVTWQQIKAKLGNLCLSRPNLKGAVSLVKIVEAGDGPSHDEPRTAYVILKSPEAAEELLTTYEFATGEFILDIRALCPSLTAVSATTDTWVRRQYPSWVAKRVETKATQHEGKRPREN